MSVFSGSLLLPLLLVMLFVRIMTFVLLNCTLLTISTFVSVKLHFIDNQDCTKAQYFELFEQHSFFSSLNITASKFGVQVKCFAGPVSREAVLVAGREAQPLPGCGE